MKISQIRARAAYNIVCVFGTLAFMGTNFVTHAQAEPRYEFIHRWASRLSFTKNDLQFGEKTFIGFKVWMGLDETKKSCALIYQHSLFRNHLSVFRLERATHLDYDGVIPGAPDGTQGVMVMLPHYRVQEGGVIPAGRAPELESWGVGEGRIYFKYNGPIGNYFDRKNPRPTGEHQEGTLDIFLDEDGNPKTATFRNKGNNDTLECKFGNLF
jgi:hypothetical protein